MWEGVILGKQSISDRLKILHAQHPDGYAGSPLAPLPRYPEKDDEVEREAKKDNTPIRAGRFLISLFDGTEDEGLLITDTETGKGMRFNGDVLENAIHGMWNEHF